MEGKKINQVKSIFKDNFIGVEELKPMFAAMGYANFRLTIPDIQYDMKSLEASSSDYLLVLGVPSISSKSVINIKTMRDVFGINPSHYEPCFYNQDWYLNEKFILNTLDLRWYLLKKSIIDGTRSMSPQDILKTGIIFPPAILCTYTFFAYYFAFNKLLWEDYFIWCSDVDHNGDRIFVGRYHDKTGVNKNGFNIHRHLSINNTFASADTI